MHAFLKYTKMGDSVEIVLNEDTVQDCFNADNNSVVVSEISDDKNYKGCNKKVPQTGVLKYD